MKRLRRLCLRLALGFSLLATVWLMIIGWAGSGHLVSPPRRELQAYHQERLHDPAAFGLSITAFTAPGGTPALQVTPALQPALAVKSRALRHDLSSRGITPGPWGHIHGTIVMLHGHGGRKEDHLPICERFCAAGFRCLVPDLPAHGDHPSDVATFGKNEVELIERLIDDAATTFGFDRNHPVMLFGVSQGGAIALQTAARNPDRWAAVASVAAFGSLDRAVRGSVRDLNPWLAKPASLHARAVAAGCWLRGGFTPGNTAPLRIASRIEMPAFIAHGEHDRLVSVRDARAIFDALPRRTKKFRIIAGAGHSDVLAADAVNLYPELCAFFLGALPPVTSP